MKKSRYTETQIVKAIKEHEAGKSVQDICRELGVSNVTFYNWKQRYGGMEVSDVKINTSSNNTCSARWLAQLIFLFT